MTASTAAFWDRLADGYAAKPVKDPKAYEHTLARARSHLSAQDRVLEIGCGTGTTALALADGVSSIHGTDISSRMIEIARDKARDQNVTNAGFAAVDADVLALPDGAPTAVLAFNLLHLLDDPAETVRQIFQTLPTGGTFISKTVCLGGQAWLFAPLIGLLRLFGKAPKVHMITVEAMDRMVRQAGFDIVETGTFPARPASRFIVARKP